MRITFQFTPMLASCCSLQSATPRGGVRPWHRQKPPLHRRQQENRRLSLRSASRPERLRTDGRRCSDHERGSSVSGRLPERTRLRHMDQGQHRLREARAEATQRAENRTIILKFCTCLALLRVAPASPCYTASALLGRSHLNPESRRI